MGAFSPSPVTAVASAVGAVAGAVGEGEKLADDSKLLTAGAAEGVALDEKETEKRVKAGDDAAANASDQLRSTVEAAHFSD